MRRFRDHEGNAWVATVAREEGGDYKGRFYFVVDGEGEHEDRRVSLTDGHWNPSRTAQRTLATMSEVELRRRLRSALGRASSAAVV